MYPTGGVAAGSGYGSKGPAHHVTLTIGDYTLHYDNRQQGWWPNEVVAETYQGNYSLLEEFTFPDRRQRTKPPASRYPTLGVIRWKYLLGPAPLVCAGVVAQAMTQNGEETPLYVDPNDLLEYVHDRYRIEWQGSDR